MSRHGFALLDVNLSSGLADYFPDATSTTQLGLRPRADDFDVIALTNDRHSMLVTADQGFIRKCKVWQEQHRELSLRLASAAPRHRIPMAIFSRIFSAGDRSYSILSLKRPRRGQTCVTRICLSRHVDGLPSRQRPLQVPVGRLG